MKNICTLLISCCVIMLLSQSLKAQMTLIHAFNSDEEIFFDKTTEVPDSLHPPFSISRSRFIDSTNIYRIIYYNPTGQETHRYDYHFTIPSVLVNDVVITVEDTIEYAWSIDDVIPTRKVFNNNDSLEFFVIFRKPNEMNYDSTKMLLVNENNDILFDFALSFNYLNDNSNSYLYENLYCTSYLIDDVREIFLRRRVPGSNRYITEVYIIEDANATGLVPSILRKRYEQAFPNPCSTIVNLPYKLEDGETASMNIYNAAGKLVDTKQIESKCNVVTLNVENYRKGLYIYEVNGISNKFIVE